MSVPPTAEELHRLALGVCEVAAALEAADLLPADHPGISYCRARVERVDQGLWGSSAIQKQLDEEKAARSRAKLVEPTDPLESEYRRELFRIGQELGARRGPRGLIWDPTAEDPNGQRRAFEARQRARAAAAGAGRGRGRGRERDYQRRQQMSGLLEIRAGSDGASWQLTGLASRTGVWYEVNDASGRYQEQILPGAFRGSLSRDPSVRLLVEHNRTGPLLARTGRNMTLRETSDGLAVTANLARDDPDAQAAYSKIRNGLLDSMSFSFRVAGGDAGQEWSGSRRTLRAVDLDGGDVSLTMSPANPQTEVSVRGASLALAGSALAEAVGYEVRATTSGVAVVESRAAKYTPAEIEQLGRQGKAFRNPDGHFSFPVVTRQDLLSAIHAVGRSGLADKAPLRRFIARRARELNAARLIPASWNAATGSRSPTYRSVRQLRRELEALSARSRRWPS